MEFGTFFKLILGLFYLTGMVPKFVHRDKSQSSGSDQDKNLALTCWSLLSFTALCILIAIVFTSEGVFGQHKIIASIAVYLTIIVQFMPQVKKNYVVDVNVYG